MAVAKSGLLVLIINRKPYNGVAEEYITYCLAKIESSCLVKSSWEHLRVPSMHEARWMWTGQPIFYAVVSLSPLYYK